MGLTKYDISNIDRILSGTGDWFSANLIRLIAQADSVNARILARAYPMEFIQYCKYKYGGVPRDYWGIIEVRDLVNETDASWLDENGKLYGKIIPISGRDFGG